MNQWYLCGRLNKKGKIIKKWKSRFAVIHKRGYFATYETIEDAKVELNPTEMVRLNYITNVSLSDPEETKQEHAFSITYYK